MHHCSLKGKYIDLKESKLGENVRIFKHLQQNETAREEQIKIRCKQKSVAETSTY